MNIRERLGKELLFLDGGMGTLLQAEGLAPGELPETWNIEHPEKVEAIHRRYYEAGSDVVLANTFGANVCKFHDDRYTVEEVIRAGKKYENKNKNISQENSTLENSNSKKQTIKGLRAKNDQQRDEKEMEQEFGKTA